MKIGFTGTQEGQTKAQKKSVRQLLKNATEFHSGDCVGADEQAHNIAVELQIETHIHPPDNPIKRAFCKGDKTYPEKKYIKRNHDIVDSTDRIIATPKGFEEELRSGTWSTIRYAIKKHKKVGIVWPDGKVTFK